MTEKEIKKEKKEVKIIEIPIQTEKVLQLPDGTQLDEDEWKVWLSEQILEIKKAVV